MHAAIPHCYVCETPSNVSASNTCTTSEREISWIQDIYLFPKSPGIERVPTFTHSRTHSLTHSLSHSHSHSLTHSLTLSHSLSLSLSLTHSPTLSHSLTHSLSHSHSHYQQLDCSSNSSVISRGLRGAWVWEHVVLEDVEEAGLGGQ
jgi:hypothetical protein